ncbi:MAG: riboflavin synthase [Selenomonadaceae bacterium]|nr:riboflavin synthase [Selenomonadaceae bacterium]MBR1858368.1 riboflavin synthase [Selenomonadaceae bacterium]
MFTGIIEEIGSLHSFSKGVITINCNKILDDIKIGDSISTNGICLTVTAFDKTTKNFSADVMPETIRRTSLESLKRGDIVNLERALKVDDRLGGHIVSGHIDGVGKIKSIKPEGNAFIVTIEADKNLLRYIASKGSVALDGMSLTVVDVSDRDFSVSLIPHTRDVTNFKHKNIGSLVNIETDVLAKYIERLMNFNNGGITKDFLTKNGFYK